MAILKPEANVTINKGRTKVHKDGKVYLKEGSEFEIELYNPTTTNVQAKISMNGVDITQGGLIIKPGQRYFLERFLDVAKKFKFETYEVEDTKEVSDAIAKNGVIEINFYPEQVKPAYKTTTYPTLKTQFYDYNGTGGLPIGTTSGGNVTLTTSNSDFLNMFNPQFDTQMNSSSYYSSSVGGELHSRRASIETGRIEKGAESDQSFTQVFMDFSFFTIAKYTFKLLPVSQEPVVVQQITNYCGACGCKCKSKHIFCSSCGEKL